MEIGMDDLDFVDEVFESDNNTTTQNNDVDTIEEGSPYSENDEDTELQPTEEDFLSSFLKTRGIEDKSKIKFENDEGQIEEIDWESLSNEDKISILNSSSGDPESDLDESEIQLLNSIRSSNLSPQEYMQAVAQLGINNYIQSQLNTRSYKVDDYSDDELFVMDLLSRTQEITEDEAYEALEKAKSNEALYKKLIGALRNEYKHNEEEIVQYEEYQKQQQAQEQFNLFAYSIENSLNNFTELAGGKLDMDNNDMQEIYDFITGFDAAGNSYFGKALNDPDIVVRMAWFALHGEETIRNIEDYYNKEITKAREEGYKKGIAKKDTSKVVYKNKKPESKSDIFDDLD